MQGAEPPGPMNGQKRLALVGTLAAGLWAAGMALNYGPLVLLAFVAITAGLLWNEDTFERGEHSVSNMLSTAITTSTERRTPIPTCACIRPALVIDPDFGHRPHCYKCGKTGPRQSRRDAR